MFCLANKLDLCDDTLYASCDINHKDGTPDDPNLVTSDASCLTDVCNLGNLPEVEILSLIEEQIPKYRLRADTITNFCGYDNQDWIQTPLIPIDEDLELSNDQIQETLKYFVLCSDRVTQMTKTYNDIEAVNRLLEEKERDLELAAKIGQTLLTKNQELSEKNDVLEEQLGLLSEKVNQIKHELSLKDGLLQAFSENVDLSPSDESSGSTDCLQYLGGACAIEKKVKVLEEENLKLRLETEQLSSETSRYEEKEQKLVDDCVAQLSAKKKELDLLAEELIKRSEECSGQKEEITGLLAMTSLPGHPLPPPNTQERMSPRGMVPPAYMGAYGHFQGRMSPRQAHYGGAPPSLMPVSQNQSPSSLPPPPLEDTHPDRLVPPTLGVHPLALLTPTRFSWSI